MTKYYKQGSNEPSTVPELVVDNLTTDDSKTPLSANQGKVLSDKLALIENQTTTSAYGYSTDLNTITDKNLIATLSGSYTNSPLGTGSSNITGMLKVERRVFDAGFAVYQEVKIQGGSVHWRYGTGQPLVFGDWNQDFSENHLPEISEVVGLQEQLDKVRKLALAGL